MKPWRDLTLLALGALHACALDWRSLTVRSPPDGSEAGDSVLDDGGFNGGPEASFDEATCVGTSGRFCANDLDGFLFVNAVSTLSDFCLARSPPPMDTGALPMPAPGNCEMIPPTGATTMHLSRGPGKVCLSGWVSQNGWALISLEFFLWNRTFTGWKPFDAAARGITQVRMSIDSQRVDLNAGAISSLECPNGPQECGWARFRYTDLSLPGQVTAPFRAFKSDGQGLGFDAHALGTLFMGTPAGPEGDYAFCISDFSLLNDQGEPVSP